MALAQAGQQLSEKVSVKAFLRGLGFVFALYLLLCGWVIIKADTTIEAQQQKLASQTVIVDWPAKSLLQKKPQPADDQKKQEDQPEEQAKKTDIVASTGNSSISLLESGLAKAPVEGLYKETGAGHLPVIRTSDGLTPFKAYRRPFDVYATDQPLIAIAIKGLGLSDIATESAVRSMPPEISFIMSPYGPTLDFWVNESRQKGHEVWLTLPVESENYPLDDPGPHTILIGATERDNQRKMEWLLSRTDGYVGFVTGPQPAFMKANNDMRPIVGNLYHRGLALIDGAEDPNMIPQTMAVGMKAPYGNIDIWIDKPDASQQAIQEALTRLEEISRKKGFATGVIHTLPVSYQQTLKWLETLPDKGIALAPLSATTGY